MADVFGHENLDVYRAALRFSVWVEDRSADFSCSTDLLQKLDKTSTAIVLNIAEGNGRFSGADQAKFLRIAYKATIQSASLVDLVTLGMQCHCEQMSRGLKTLREVAAMLTSLSKAVLKDT